MLLPCPSFVRAAYLPSPEQGLYIYTRVEDYATFASARVLTTPGPARVTLSFLFRWSYHFLECVSDLTKSLMFSEYVVVSAVVTMYLSCR